MPIRIYKISRESSVRETNYAKCNRMRARARSKAMWLNSVLQGRYEVAGCGGCGDGWASLMKVQAVDVCGNDMIVEIYIRYPPLKNSFLNRYRKYGIEFNVTAPETNH